MAPGILHASKPLGDTWLSASSGTFFPSGDGHQAKSGDGARIDSVASRVLIVDDDPIVLELVSGMALRLGYHPTTAKDAVDALFFLTRTHYDLVITDYDMPSMNGFQLAQQIKKKYFKTRVIIMTGHCEQDIENSIFESGIVDGLLLKPFNLKIMREKIEMAGPMGSPQWTL